MPSPFPGMDPYLESPAVWPDFHNRFIAVLSQAINALLPAPLFCSIANRVYVEESKRRVEPDADILHPKDSVNGAPHANGAGGVAVVDNVQTKPVIVPITRDEVTEWFAEIHAAPGGERLVTTIELLSPSNKRPKGTGARKYRKKQREMLHRRVNLIEIDLLRGGRHSTSVPLADARHTAGPFDYHVCVHRYKKAEQFEVYPIALQGPLPAIAVPLLPKLPDLTIALQPILTGVYDAGQYTRRVRYNEPLPPPELTAEQQAWVAERLQARTTT
jgi:Protein of unknown function (DUF4058)